MENCSIYIYKNSQDTTWSVGFVMGPAIGHSAQSVFAKVTNTKEENSLQTIRPEAWRGSGKCLFCDSSWFAMAAPINLCSNLWVSGMHSESKLLFILFCGCQSPHLGLNAIGGMRGPRMLNSAADTTVFLKDLSPDLLKQNVTVIVKIYINGKELTRSHSYQIWQT